MKIGAYQGNPEFGLVEKNVRQAVTELEGADADLVVMPELFNTGYQFVSKEEAFGLAEEMPYGDTCRSMMEIARSKKMHLVFGMAERDGARLFNSAAVVGPEGFIGRYRKSHLFYEEKYFFDPGDTGFMVFDIGIARLGVMICFDWWFPEAARSLALSGADIICHPANLVLYGCHKAMITRSLENGVFSITANRTGSEARGGKEPLVFTGESQIVDNRGSLLASMNRDGAGIVVVDIDVKRARDKSITTLNDRFKDRRPDLYGEITKSNLPA
ncbi:MAG: acyltransferase [Deltaproteobacteria bacterium]|nr:acyltransferase [Deltaproteobacteria bacterium]